MPRLIDAEAFENYVFDEWKKNEISNGDWIQFREWLKDQKTIVEFDEPITRVMVKDTEYFPVVWCSDCKNWDTDWQTVEGLHYCPMVDKQTDGEWFCADAEGEKNDHRQE